jgi:hypothetical protein
METLHNELVEGNLIYYANTLKQVTPSEILFMSKTDIKGAFAEPVPITKASLRACNFKTNIVDTCYILVVSEGADIKVHFEQGASYNRITLTKLNPTTSNLWQIKEEIFLHDLQNLSRLLLGNTFNLI